MSFIQGASRLPRGRLDLRKPAVLYNTTNVKRLRLNDPPHRV